MSVDNVADISPINQYVASASQTAFDYDFPIFEEADLVVYVNDTLQVLTTNYTVTGETEDTGGTVTFTAGLEANDIVTIYRDAAIERTTDFQQNGARSSTAMNDELDRITMWMQQLERNIGRAVRMTLRNPQASADLELDAAFEGAYLYVNDDGELEPAAAVAETTLSQSILGALLWPLSDLETAASLTNADLNRAYYYGDLRRYLGTGGDSTVDTLAFTNALAAGHAIRIPKMSSAWEFTGPILVPSDTVIVCDPGVEVMMPDGGLVSDIGWIRFRDVENITIHGNNSRWYFETKPSADEQRHAFDVRGSSNVTLRDLLAEDSGGDGFYVGAGATNLYSQNVRLENCRADNCRRQGLSIVSVINCWVDDCYFSNITGTSPQAGIDIEPNGATDEIRGVRITNVITANCTGPGIKIVTNDLPSDYPIDIVITGHKDTGSENAFNPQFGTQMTGGIVYRDCHSVEAQGSGAFIRGWRSVSAPILIENFTCDDPNAANDTTNAYNGHAVSIFSTGSDAADDIGNIDIIGLRARDRRGSPQMKSAVYVRNTVATGTSSKVRVIRPLEMEGHTNQAVEMKFTSSIVLDDPYELTRINHTASGTVSTSSQHALHTNLSASGTVTLSLDSNCAVGERRRFRVEAAFELRIDPDGASSILPAGGGAGVYIASNVIGSEIELERKSSTVWYIVKKIGIWSPSTGTVDPTYTMTNVTTDRSADADAALVAEVADVLGTLIADLRAQGIVK
jgi:hypothetical protein